MKIIRFLFITGFLITSVYHTVGLIAPEMTEPVSFQRHMVFIIVNLTGSFLLYLNKPKFLLLLFVLIIQQLWSHGTYGIEVYQTQGGIDWASVIVCLSMPVLGYFIYKRQHGK